MSKKSTKVLKATSDKKARRRPARSNDVKRAVAAETSHFEKPALEHAKKFLVSYGYLRSSESSKVKDWDDIALTSALAKFQRFDANVANLKEMTGEPLLANGVWGPSTWLVMNMPRCGEKDFENGEPLHERALGDGGWNSCLVQGEHGAIVDVVMSTIPNHVKPNLVQIHTNVQYSFAQVGNLFRFRNSSTKKDLLTGEVLEGRTQIVASYTRGSGWIGLALVGPFGCNQEVWCRYDNRWNPANLVREQTTLWKHELGHNCGLRHGGRVMNATLLAGLPIEWEPNDSSTPILNRYFGGIPVDIPGTNPDDPNPPTPPDNGDWPGIGKPLSNSFELFNGKRAVLMSMGAN
jgi:hypothetical protein